MLASIIMECKGVALHRSAAVSALRYINNGPQSLVLALRNTYSHAELWALVTLLLYLTTFALQFVSTVLVDDLGMGSLVGHTKNETVFAALSWHAGTGQINATRLTGETSYWTEYLPDFPTFAENHEGPLANEGPPEDFIRDTGTTLRAFIPVSNQSERTSIHSYSGVATVEDSRVVCIRPKLHQYFSIGYISGSLGYVLNGSLAPEFIPPGLILGEEPAMTSGVLPMTYSLGTNQSSDSTVTLSWSQQIPLAHEGDGWAIAQNFMYFGPTLVSSLDPRYPNIASNGASMNFTMTNPDYLAWNLTYYQDGDNVSLMTGRSYELLNVSIADPGTNTNMFFSPDQDENKLVIDSQNEWLVFTIPSIPDFRLSVSLCFDSFVSINAKVNLTSQQSSSEPPLGAWNKSSGCLGTAQARQQLGALPGQNQSVLERGIMSLETTPEQLRDQVKVWYDEAESQGAGNISFPSQNFVAMVSKDTYSWGTWMCKSCGMDFVNQSNVNISYVANNKLQEQIFQDVIRTTSDTSKAWQAYYTILGRLAFYQTLPYYDIEDTPAIARFRDVQFPRSMRGLAAVVAALCVHIFLVVLITAAFLVRTRVSRVGDNAWLNLAQTNLPAMEDVFKASSTMRDGDLKKELAAQGMKNDIVRIR